MTEPAETVEKHGRPWWRWLLWIIVAVLLLPVMAVLLLQLESVQDYLRRQGELYLQKKLRTKVHIGYLRARGWQYLELRDVSVNDTANQALLFSGSLKVRYNLLTLLNNELRINKLEWDTVLINVYRLPGDSAFNYQFAADAFSSKKKDTIAAETGTTMSFNIKDITLRVCRVRYVDHLTGMTAVLTWKELHADPDELLIDDGVYALRGIKLDGLKGFLKQNYIPKEVSAAAPPPPPPDTGASSSMHLLLKKLQIINSAFLYADQGSGIRTAWKVGELDLRNSSIDLDSTRIQVGELNIRRTNGLFEMLPGKDTSTPAPADTTPNTWKVYASKVSFEKLAVRYDNGSPAPRAAGTGPNQDHLMLTNINAQASNLRYQPDSISARLRQFTAQDWSGFRIKKATADFLFTPQQLALKDLLVQTNRSLLQKHIVVTVPSWSGIADHLDQMQLDANLDTTRIALDEWLPFVPNARSNKNFAPLWDKQLTIAAVLKGSMRQLQIKKLFLLDNKGNLVQTQGTVGHVTDMDKLQADLPELLVKTGNKPLRSWLPAGTLPDTPRLPENMIITGAVKGGMQDMLAKLQLQSDLARANINAHLIRITDSINSRYDISMPDFRINAGAMMYDTTMGWVSGSLTGNGHGYTLKNMIAQASIQLSEARFNRYTYHDIQVSADINKGLFQAEGHSNDTSFTTVFNINGRLADNTVTSLIANVKLEKADLFNTHWYDAPLTLKGNLLADFGSLQPQRLEGAAYLTDWQVVTKDQVIPVDSISLTARYEDQQYILLTAPFGEVNAWGQIDYTKVGDAFAKIINKPIQPVDSSRIVTVPPGQILQWNASVQLPRNLQPLVPGLRMDKPLIMDGRLNSDSSLLILNASLAKVNYDSLQVDSLRIMANIADTTLKAAVTLADLKHPMLPLHRTHLLASAKGGVVDWNLLMDDVKNQPKYKLGGLLRFLPANVMELSLKPDLLLNKQQWAVEENNIIRLKDSAPDTAHLVLSQGSQSIQISTEADSTGGTRPAVRARIKDFQLATITGLVGSDTLLATGLLNADALVRNWDKSPLANGTLSVDSLTFRGTAIGRLDARLNNDEPGKYVVAAGIEGNDNDIKIDGTYDSTITAQVNINKLNMASLEPFTFGSMSKMHGSANGKFDIAGTIDKPSVSGNLHFNNAGGTVNYLGAPLRLPDEDIVVDEKGILLNNLVIADSLNNELVVNGRINTTDFKKYSFFLDVNADNFMALGKQQNDDQWIYGPAFIDSRVKIRGNLDLPRIDAYVKLRDKSTVTVMLPQSEPGLADREGVIEFVDRSHPVDSALLAKVDSTKFENPRLKGIIFSGNAEITPASTIKIIIDQQNGDFVEAKGTANINATLDPSSKLSLTGRYEISEGKYEMSLNQLIKRSFAIQKGSFISFNGDATSADLDITAKYTVETSAADLVADQLAGMSATDRNRYKQRLPFDVYLMIKGDLMKPDISFRLDMPERERNAFGGSVYNRLKQINQVPSELNKQVMGLLVLNTFIPEDPLNTLDAGGGGGGVEQVARNSVSKILSQQLNNLAGNLIKGVDLNFDLQSKQDYSSGSAQEQTSLNIGASKNLFNDRLTVSVGSNIMLQGQSQSASSLVGDISVEYKLTEDGRYRVRVFQRNNRTVIDAQVVETGVSFMLVMDYDEFREIFQRAKREGKKEKLRDNKNKDNKK